MSKLTKDEETRRDDFLQKVARVCQEFNLSIGHEDGHGAFIVRPYDPEDIEWLMAAHKD